MNHKHHDCVPLLPALFLMAMVAGGISGVISFLIELAWRAVT